MNKTSQKPGQDSAQRPTKHIDYQFSIYRSAYLKYRSKVSIHPLIYHSNLSASVSSRFIYLSICLSIYLSTYLSIYQSINLSIYLSISCMSIGCVSVYLSISLLSLPLSFVPYYNNYGLDSAQHTFKPNKLHGLDSAQHSFKQTPWAGFRPTFTHSKQTHSKQTPWAGFRPTVIVSYSHAFFSYAFFPIYPYTVSEGARPFPGFSEGARPFPGG